MAVRKPVHDPEALAEAVDFFGRALTSTIVDDHGPTVAQEISEDLAQSFRYAEFETVTTRVAGETVTMRRLVLTGEWAVQTD
jgi:hypothetical protein